MEWPRLSWIEIITAVDGLAMTMVDSKCESRGRGGRAVRCARMIGIDRKQ